MPKVDYLTVACITFSIGNQTKVLTLVGLKAMICIQLNNNFWRVVPIIILTKKDIKSVRKFVKAFHSMDLKHDFLKSLSLLGELLELEEESGNYMEAVHIAKMICDVIHEADLLGKAGAFGGHRRTARWRALFAGAVAGQSMLLTGLGSQHTSPTGHLKLNL